MESPPAKPERVSRQLSRSFDVFISYSRKDRAFAVRLEEALENYRFPRGIGDVVDRLNVFRDEADITAADDYHRAIEETLVGSGRLVVVCSPDAYKSTYVDDEIRRYIATRGADRILPVIVRGKPNNEATDPAERAFPEALCDNRMPLAADFLGCENYKGPLHRGPYASAFFSLLASIVNVDRRALEQIDERALRRRRLATAAVAGGVIVALSVALIVALTERQLAVENGRAAVANYDSAVANGKRAAQSETAAMVSATNARRNESLAVKNESLARKATTEAELQRSNAEAQAKIAQTERDAALDAQRRLQLQLLKEISRMAVNNVMTDSATAGEIVTAARLPWTTLLRTTGSGMKPSTPLTFAAARDVQQGRVLAVAHMAVLEGKGEGFMEAAIEWLRGPRGAKVIVVSSGHCEVETLANQKLKIPATLLNKERYALRNAPGALSDNDLRDAGVLIVPGGGGSFTQGELDAIHRFVDGGGGLFGAGLGWAWVKYGGDCLGKTAGQIPKDLSTYPMNRLFAPYGLMWTGRF